jgi:hypothetical protein
VLTLGSLAVAAVAAKTALTESAAKLAAYKASLTSATACRL